MPAKNHLTLEQKEQLQKALKRKEYLKIEKENPKSAVLLKKTSSQKFPQEIEIRDNQIDR